jgi:hypothetical protein
MSRPDVGAAHPAFGQFHGYQFEVPVAPGNHFVCVYAVSDVTGYGTFLGLGQVTVQGPFGSLDVASALGGGNVRVAGWAIDPSIESQGGTLEVSVDGNTVLRFTATGSRTDVGTAYPQAGPNHGYDVTVQAGVGQHKICVTAFGTRGGVQQLGCQVISVT